MGGSGGARRRVSYRDDQQVRDSSLCPATREGRLESLPYTRGYHSPVTAILGRLCQLIGLLLLPIGLSYGLLKDNIGMEVRLLFIGGAFFVLGWLMSRQKS